MQYEAPPDISTAIWGWSGGVRLCNFPAREDSHGATVHRPPRLRNTRAVRMRRARYPNRWASAFAQQLR